MLWKLPEGTTLRFSFLFLIKVSTPLHKYEVECDLRISNWYFQSPRSSCFVFRQRGWIMGCDVIMSGRWSLQTKIEVILVLGVDFVLKWTIYSILLTKIYYFFSDCLQSPIFPWDRWLGVRSRRMERHTCLVIFSLFRVVFHSMQWLHHYIMGEFFDCIRYLVRYMRYLFNSTR